MPSRATEPPGWRSCLAWGRRASPGAFRFAVHYFDAEEMRPESLAARVMAWMAEKRTAVNNDPRIVPRILGVAEPIRFPPGSCSAMPELSESCVAQSFPR